MGTPEWWLALHGLTNDTFDVEETNDWDGDGMLAWEEWVAGTDPTNASSSLRITDVSRAANGRSPISFTSVSGKIYRIAVTTNLLPDNWWGSEYATTEDGGFQINAITGTAETTTIYVEPSGIPQFYRVEVQ